MLYNILLKQYHKFVPVCYLHPSLILSSYGGVYLNTRVSGYAPRLASRVANIINFLGRNYATSGVFLYDLDWVTPIAT